MRLADFINDRRQVIVDRWIDFASELGAVSAQMSENMLRDHVHEMLDAIADDISQPESAFAADEKSKGRAPRQSMDDTGAESHASARLASGFTIEQLVAEFRALRASVLHLWETQEAGSDAVQREDVRRFNEAIDQALAESLARYATATKKTNDLFLGIVGHDLRTPLSVTMHAAELIIRISEPGSDVQRFAQKILKSGGRMHRLVNDLTEFARAQVGQSLIVVRTPSDLADICRVVVEEAKLLHPDRKVILATDGDARGEWDSGRMTQAVANLVMNALQHAAADRPVTVALHARQDGITLTVQNFGSPIGAADLPHIFEPMRRGAAASTPGVGLGLFIVKEIIAAHDGTVSVACDADVGTIFAVKFSPRASAVTVVRSG